MTIGCGVDLPPGHAGAHDNQAPEPGPEVSNEVNNEAGTDVGDPAVDEASPSFRPHLAQRGTTFRRRHRLHGPFVLYWGRIDA